LGDLRCQGNSPYTYYQRAYDKAVEERSRDAQRYAEIARQFEEAERDSLKAVASVKSNNQAMLDNIPPVPVDMRWVTVEPKDKKVKMIIDYNAAKCQRDKIHNNLIESYNIFAKMPLRATGERIEM